MALLRSILPMLTLAIPAGAQPAPSQPRHPVDALLQPVAVFGTDERKPLPQSRLPLAEKIGVLVLADTRFCTAFCLGPDVIATASHCLLGTQQSPGPDLAQVRFKVGQSQQFTSRLYGGTYAAIRAGLRTGTPRLRITPPIAAVRDWGLVRLVKPVCHAGGLALSTLTREDIEVKAASGGVYMAAMHRDFASSGIVQSGPCQIARTFPQAGSELIAHDFLEARSVLLHTCDTTPGSSGAPLLVDGPNGSEVVGLNVGTYVISRSASGNGTHPTTVNSEARTSSGLSQQAIANTAIATAKFKSAAELFLAASALAGKARLGAGR